jgi:hypothetical protein
MKDIVHADALGKSKLKSCKSQYITLYFGLGLSSIEAVGFTIRRRIVCRVYLVCFEFIGLAVPVARFVMLSVSVLLEKFYKVLGLIYRITNIF